MILKRSSFLEGTIIATVAIVLVKILGMLYVIPFYATVGVQGSALYAYAYNIYIIFLDISTAGIPTSISKIISEYETLGKKDAKVRAYHIGLKLLGFISIAAFIAVFLCATPLATMIIGDMSGGNTIADVAFVIRAVSFALLVIPFLSVTKGYLQGHNIINVSSISEVIEQVMRIVVILGGSYLALNVFHLSLRSAVGIAVFGACAGGLFSLSYVLGQVHKNRKALDLADAAYPKDDISNKDILKKILKYAVPFIIISVALNVYNFVDMILILRTLKHLSFSTYNIEFITSALTTWSAKLGMIVTSIGMGMTISLIPTIVRAGTKKDKEDINHKYNQALQILMITTIPMVVGLSMLSTPVWSVFYGYSLLGSATIQVSIFVAAFQCFFLISNSTLQGLNRFRAVYVSTFAGLLTNMALDVPLMLICDRIGVHAFYGASIASMIGYSLSVVMACYTLKKHYDVTYQETIGIFFRILIPLAAMIVVLLILRVIFPFDATSKWMSILFIAVSTIAGAITYLGVAYRMGLLRKIFGKDMLDRIIKKLTFGKFSAKY